ncbi:hypothetical protein BCR33DRAFT_847599 [Rhizoclosmatium globosum]|uniref:NAD(P)-binding domain-containing protein n=1 Tax=Rhizoclosmatium globosum TaxID=329046 RepID=A0A1Y2CPG2_9FUNG|nr:hypothetical protein BCR33DRAFT_847599 [Rhizoclosmatium globosum]|eukprot:ORY48892.1 hypothetical protein BCR33DRAFT_847599 [Rhizoclosmatium globosum]
MSVFRAKHTIAVFETNSKTSAQFVGHALQNGHHVVALWNQNKTFTEAKNFSVANTLDELLVNADVVVIAGGAEHHQAAHHAVKRVAAYVEANKVQGYKLKHIYLVSAEGAKPTAPFLQRALYAELIHAEKDLVELVAKHVNIKYTVFRPPTLIETSKSNDVFVYDEAAEKNLTDLAHQVSYSGLADAVLEIVETQPKFVNKVAGVNSKQALVEAHELRAIQSRKTASAAFWKYSPFVVGLAAVAAGVAFYVQRQ